MACTANQALLIVASCWARRLCSATSRDFRRSCWLHRLCPLRPVGCVTFSLAASPFLIPPALGTMRPVPRVNFSWINARSAPLGRCCRPQGLLLEFGFASPTSRGTRDGTERKVLSQTLPVCLALSHANSADTSSRVSASRRTPLVKSSRHTDACSESKSEISTLHIRATKRRVSMASSPRILSSLCSKASTNLCRPEVPK